MVSAQALSNDISKPVRAIYAVSWLRKLPTVYYSTTCELLCLKLQLILSSRRCSLHLISDALPWNKQACVFFNFVFSLFEKEFVLKRILDAKAININIYLININI